MVFAKLFRRADPYEDVALRLYGVLVEKARDRVFYAQLAVPDTINGRFDMLIIHAMLLLRRLRGAGVEAEKVGRATLELMFKDMDRSLRERGVGDMGIGRHIKKMGKAMFGRAEVYEAGLDGDDATLTAALKENIYRQAQPDGAQLERILQYMRRAADHLSKQDVADVMAGKIDFQVPVLE